MTEAKKLYKSEDKILGGVAGGMAEYLGVDATVMRILWLLFGILTHGWGILLYVVMWFIMPVRGKT